MAAVEATGCSAGVAGVGCAAPDAGPAPVLASTLAFAFDIRGFLNAAAAAAFAVRTILRLVPDMF